MKKLLILIPLFLSGCGFGYEVTRQIVCVVPTPGSQCDKLVAQYTCVYQRPILWFNLNVAICDTAQECNKICEEKTNVRNRNN